LCEVCENALSFDLAFVVPDREDVAAKAEAEEIADYTFCEVGRPVRYAEDCDTFRIEKMAHETSFRFFDTAFNIRQIVTGKQAVARGCEAVKKSFGDPLPLFRRKPESGTFRRLQAAWTPVCAGVTTKMGFFHSFCPANQA
jgi:hypothetical protein